MAAAEENRIELIPYVACTPEWAARESKDFWKQPPRDPRLWEMANGPSEFLRRLMVDHHVDRYVDVIAAHAYPET